ncbi:group I truncated hemoglobin [Archangium lansingense]|uniref:Group 1 truncated hemoglobin n=1 Tax=Archangium lansingense TaxID=2995310 RepID=A0ABT4A4V4_9BACT|nr:group 1 truncated hemoglobin [Archangium lansinium]MCY1076675.1 group 1 truncated hemoglobin [Archangium lansinium]
MHQNQSLYEQLGGEEMVSKTVTIFYQKVLADSLLRPFFENMNMSRLESMQRAFLVTAFGGPNAYSGRDMRRAHTRLVARGMSDAHFDAVLTHLDDTLTELNVAKPLRDWARALTDSLRKDILGR